LGVVNLVALAYVLKATSKLKATTKEGRQLSRRRKVHPQRKSWIRLCHWDSLMLSPPPKRSCFTRRLSFCLSVC